MAKATLPPRLPQTEEDLLLIVHKLLEKKIEFTVSYRKFAGVQLHISNNGKGDNNLQRAGRAFKSLLPSVKGMHWGKTFDLALSGTPDKNGE